MGTTIHVWMFNAMMSPPLHPEVAVGLLLGRPESNGSHICNSYVVAYKPRRINSETTRGRWRVLTRVGFLSISLERPWHRGPPEPGM